MQPLQPRTKIVATIGPSSEAPDILAQMIRAGMSVARLNFSHGEFESHRRVIENIRAAAKAVGQRVAIMADLSGPKMRIGKFSAEKVLLKAGDPFALTTDEVVGDATRVSVSFGKLPQVVKPGDQLSLNDGYIQLEVSDVKGSVVSCVVKVGGELRSRKGLNLPGIDLGISAFTDRDRECLRFALENGVDAVSQSFVEGAADLLAVREAARQYGHDPFLIAKIERSRALENLDEILAVSDGIMVARGDLGVEVPIERIAVAQKDIVRRANQLGKPVIIATQMLESMTTYRLPTRAEVTDVSNAILDGADCVMLSGESAMGAFPVEAVEMLAKIAVAVEPIRHKVSVKELFAGKDLSGHVRPEHLVAISIEACLDHLLPAAIMVPSLTGTTARRLASLHLPVPVLAVSASQKVCQDLQFSSGVRPIHEPLRPASWSAYIKAWLKSHEHAGDFALLTERSESGDHLLEVVALGRP